MSALDVVRSALLRLPSRPRPSGWVRHAALARALLCACLAFGLSVAAGSVNAVTVNPRGFGQVLIFPYYTVRPTPAGDTYATLFFITNTTAETKLLRARFLESRNGREIASVTIYLTPYDSWTGGVLPGTPGPNVASADGSCTDPPLAGNPPHLDFSNASYSGVNGDGEIAGLDRTSEGYFEVYEMGVVKDASILAPLKPDRPLDFGAVKPDCAAVRTIALDNETKLGPPTGGLMGSASIISVFAGTLYSYDATALDDFSRVPIWSPSVTGRPNLSDVNPKESRILDASGYRQSSWDPAKGANAADPVTAVLMQDALINQFILDQGTRSGTDWIVTMPTKPFYTGTSGGALVLSRLPFESAFAAGGAPDYFGILPGPLRYGYTGKTAVHDREGGYWIGLFDWAPNPSPRRLFLPWVANVMTFGATNVFASPASVNYAGSLPPNGWLSLSPYPYPHSSAHRLTSTDVQPTTYFGLPMIGFMGNNYMNGQIDLPTGRVLANYGATSPHKGTVRIE